MIIYYREKLNPNIKIFTVIFYLYKIKIRRGEK